MARRGEIINQSNFFLPFLKRFDGLLREKRAISLFFFLLADHTHTRGGNREGTEGERESFVK